MASAESCAREIMDFVLQTMRLVRTEIRAFCRDQLSVPQFRTLSYIYRTPGTSLSDIAAHLGVTLPTMSRIADRLVERGLVQREGDPSNRRRLVLNLTPKGRELFESARQHTLKQLARRLEHLSDGQLRLAESTLAQLGGALKSH
ncbi:MAG: MarR family winged helix-turn-helix transcriptional regulator [Bacillota bacterium]